MRSRHYVLLGLLAGVVGVAALTVVYPPLDDLYLENPFWNGLSEVYRELKPGRVRDAGEFYMLDAGNSTVLMVGPTSGFSSGDVVAVREYLERGGRVVLCDDIGSGNQLLEGLGLGTRFSGLLLLDPVFFDREPGLPRLLNFSVYGVKAREVVLNYATTLAVGDGLSVVEWSSPFSYVEGEGGVAVGPHPVMGRVDVGRGLLMVFSDSSVFINSMIDRGGNRGLLRMVVRGEAFVDEVHSVPTLLTRFAWVLRDVYVVLRVPDVGFGVAAFGVLLIFGYRPLFRDEEPQLDEFEEVLKSHREWDRRQLEWLWKQWRSNNGDQ